MRWQTAMLAALVLTACETNEAIDLVEVTSEDLAGDYTMLSIGGTTPDELDADYCVESGMTMTADGEFEIQHHFTQRSATGFDQPCSTAFDRAEFDLFWRGDFENTSTLVVMTINESEFFLNNADTTISNVTQEQTELVGEYNPANNRLSVAFPGIWSFDPHGDSGGKISVGGGTRGLGGGLLVFEQ